MDLGLTPGEIVIGLTGVAYALFRWSASRNVQAEDAFKAETKAELASLRQSVHSLKTETDKEFNAVKNQRIEDTASFTRSIDKFSHELLSVKKEVERFSSDLAASIQRLEQSFRADMTKLIRPPVARPPRSRK